MPASPAPKDIPKLWDRVLNAVTEMDTTEMDHVWSELKAVRQRVAKLESMMDQKAEPRAQAAAKKSERTK